LVPVVRYVQPVEFAVLATIAAQKVPDRFFLEPSARFFPALLG
jgi:hypothetical protein